MLFDKLKENNRIPFHMPGHKRNTDLLGDNLPYDIDITEIDGFDNLHNANGIISDIQNKISSLYNSRQSFILVNGSTAGILAGINSIAGNGDTVLIARNCHKSVYNAVELAKANAVYIQPEYDCYGIAKGISPYDVEQSIKKYNIKLVVLTSPTYEGVMSDIEGICRVSHKYNIPVLVDAAHGAHLIDEFKITKADIVIMSLHKTLPALTQCAVAHIYSSLVDEKDFQIKLSMFQTSSPSYVLMSSVENCIDFVNGNWFLFLSFYNNLKSVYHGLSNLKYLKILKYDDISKVVIFTGYSNISGKELSDILRQKYNIEIEMASSNYIVALTSICDTIEDLNAFKNAVLEIDSTLNSGENFTPYAMQLPKKAFECCLNPKEKKFFNLRDSEGKISAEYIWAYPPGIPIIVPGEVINNDVINYIGESIKKNIEIQSTYGYLPEKICCQKV